MFFRKHLSIFYTLLILVQGGAMFSQTKIIPYQELPDVSGTPTGSGIFFSASMSSSTITITFEGPADRWIALGFGTGMYPTDVLIYSCGHALSSHPLSWQDYYNTSHNNSGVLADALQNWTILSTNTLSSGQRTVTASRQLNTGDLNDITFTYSSTSLNLVWARGASPDYTIAYHGGNNRAHGIHLPWLSIPSASFSSSTNTLCEGSSLTYSNLSTGGLTSNSWTLSGGTPSISNAVHPSVVYPASGVYTVNLSISNSLGSSVMTQTYFVSITPTVAPSISIVQLSGSNPMCAGASLSFSANIGNGGSSPGFQWNLNGNNAGNNSPSFLPTITSNAIVFCTLSSSQACALPSSITSSPISMTVYSTDPASLSIIQSSGNNPLCSGDLAGFTAIPFNEGALPFFQWQVNGGNTGFNSPAFSSAILSNSDIVSCLLNSSSSCASSTFATSNNITMSVSPVLVPQISIGLENSGSAFCEGSLLTFTSIAQNGGSSPTYQWFIDGTLTGNNSSSFSSSSLTGTAGVYCVLNSDLICSNPSSVNSSTIFVQMLDCTSIDQEYKDTDRVEVFPNPSSGNFTIQSFVSKISEFVVYNEVGVKIHSKRIVPPNNFATIDLSKQVPGLYILELVTEKNILKKSVIITR